MIHAAIFNYHGGLTFHRSNNFRDIIYKSRIISEPKTSFVNRNSHEKLYLIQLRHVPC